MNDDEFEFDVWGLGLDETDDEEFVGEKEMQMVDKPINLVVQQIDQTDKASIKQDSNIVDASLQLIVEQFKYMEILYD